MCSSPVNKASKGDRSQESQSAAFNAKQSELKQLNVENEAIRCTRSQRFAAAQNSPQQMLFGSSLGQ